ncbi:D-aminoacyl-tRNA deacylase [Cellvibrio japonicus]|uniref:D-aminoacyl-tRNA deacylase n=1 Tax=Cellvibrio japonicus (strain Ueda107) TaxID=498211 RepID=DTD_CELJU|nr:D-aminoacyl-tRNA deacylase [Cellvibrio japonicus]B3PHR3.1 RecName: Full=D-aminoacyl-tRNA deacylase; Short=DTD; AltName: Full=Gly-tRNA(Ala) deacylase [Cellvibrio japonicus Ueda107]ACE85941.1 D-tyrosyl-tRNA(Tyr) deacylase [Cellvibrio japonicus Ueda107]QEI13859.1 D-tyrosyl-tRNA(Tyr) deacylase [Cellvibrio japonicus]QEI17433.1 D-tyrosyl-tRNA(Tyr) deacylase [Cellvibrio japonicus]QEI21009.1 D-tyrosyl-tRNA(Tyr) deacylase [Cellvibrio japonicus]
MLGLIQRVRRASVEVDQQVVGEIDQGMLLLLGIQKTDTEASADKLIDKLLAYRLFADADNRMNCNLQQVDGGILVVSQFTLAADTKKGLRPSFSSAAPPAQAQQLYDYFVTQLRSRHAKVATGIFAADMQVSLVNDGPVTFMLEMD